MKNESAVQKFVVGLARWLDLEAEAWNDPEEQMNEIPGVVEEAQKICKAKGWIWRAEK